MSSVWGVLLIDFPCFLRITVGCLMSPFLLQIKVSTGETQGRPEQSHLEVFILSTINLKWKNTCQS